MSFAKILCLVWCILWGCFTFAEEVYDEDRPYEFSFNIVDFQHRYEKKDKNGLITGEYGFITADGVYHETGYATDESGDFIITKMRNRKITSLKDAEEIFKDKPEVAKKLVEAIAKSCSGCKIPEEFKEPDTTTSSISSAVTPESQLQKKIVPILKEMMKTLTDVKSEFPKENFQSKNSTPRTTLDPKNREKVVEKMIGSAKKILSQNLNETETDVPIVGNEILERIANDLYYRFNYTISTHDHHEDGYRSGRKDGAYRAQNENGLDTRVIYLSNEFGHQPNVTFVETNSTEGENSLKGYSFLWYWQ